MASKPSPTTTTFQTNRISIASNHPFDEVLSRIHASIGEKSSWPSSISLTSQNTFTSTVNSALGPHDFMIFGEFNHGSWVGLFNVGDGIKAKRIILGNPLIAITMLKHDMNAGLFVPVEILVIEDQRTGGTNVSWNEPSKQILAGREEEGELKKAAEVLDAKLLAFVLDVVA